MTSHLKQVLNLLHSMLFSTVGVVFKVKQLFNENLSTSYAFFSSFQQL